MGLISRVSSRTYRSHKKSTWPKPLKPADQSPKNTSSSEMVSSKPKWTNFSPENSLKTDTPASSSENPKLAKSSSSPPDQVKSWEKKPDESENSPPLLTNDGVMSKVRSIFTSNESPTEACLRLPKPNLSDSSWNKAPEVAKSSFPVK